MTRFARLRAPFTLHHIIARIVNAEFRIAGDLERAAYLERLARSLGRSDWRLLAYALMSNHVHLALWSGESPSARLVQPIHVGFALWWNRQHGGLGPVFAGRHAAHVCDRDQAARVFAYLHNNVVRAGLVADAADASSLWTSHRAYLGIEPAPPWLDVDLGYALMGRGRTPDDVEAFRRLVTARANDPRDAGLSVQPEAERREARRTLRVPAEVSSAMFGGTARTVAVVSASMAAYPRWPGDEAAVLATVARYAGCDQARILSKTRDRGVVEARRLALTLWSRRLGRPLAPMAAFLGMSSGAASKQVRRGELDPLLWAEVDTLGQQLWEETRGPSSPEKTNDSEPEGR